MNQVFGNASTRGYAPVNGLRMYYEISRTGDPLVYIPPALGCVGMKSFPQLAESRSIITMDLQGHGRTADIPERPITLEQNASDVIGLLEHLGIAEADFFGESYGGVVAAMIAVRRPQLVRRVAAYAATFGPPDTALNMEILHTTAPLAAASPAFRFQRENYECVAPDPDCWPQFWNKVSAIQWRGFSTAELAAITAPFLIVQGDRDFVRLEHAVETLKLIPNAELAVIPNAGHFALFSEPERVIPVVAEFLHRPAKPLPVATAGMGYQPGETR
ncbi:MAG TPA: alpha/beta hydrolase [Rhodanobacteraceae bacterium]